MIFHFFSLGTKTLRRGAFFSGFFLMALAAIFSACAGGSKPSSPQIEPIPLTEAGVFDPMSPQEIARWQPDMRLAAWWVHGELWAVVRNSTNKPIGVNYTNFAFFSDKTLHRIGPANARIVFPQTILAPGEMAMGYFQMRDTTSLVGAYCVFEHSETRPSRCVIRDRKDALDPSKQSPPDASAAQRRPPVLVD